MVYISHQTPALGNSRSDTFAGAACRESMLLQGQAFRPPGVNDRMPQMTLEQRCADLEREISLLKSHNALLQAECRGLTELNRNYQQRYEEAIEQKNTAEENRQDQLKFLERLIEAIPAPIFYKDDQGIYLGCNRPYEEYTGIARERLIGKSVYGVWPRDLADVYHRADVDLMHR